MRPLILGFALLCAALPARALAWSWPTDGVVLRTFSFDRAHPYTAGQRRGIDIGGVPDAQVGAPAAGVVSFAGTTPGNGLTLSIRTLDGYTVALTHLGSLLVRSGDTVSEREPVGTIAFAGDAELVLPSVHLGIRYTGDENGYVDPLSLLPLRQSAPPTSPPDAAAAVRDSGA